MGPGSADIAALKAYQPDGYEYCRHTDEYQQRANRELGSRKPRQNRERRDVQYRRVEQVEFDDQFEREQQPQYHPEIVALLSNGSTLTFITKR